MPIENAQPIIVPQKVYDQWYITLFNCVSTDPNAPPSVSVEFRPLARDAGGVGEFGPGAPTHTIPDLWARITEDPQAAELFNSLVAYLTDDAVRAGVLPGST